MKLRRWWLIPWVNGFECRTSKPVTDGTSIEVCPVSELEDFKNKVIVKLEMLRGACQMHKGPTKVQIAKSIAEFIKELGK
jgi:hypothetical protein